MIAMNCLTDEGQQQEPSRGKSVVLDQRLDDWGALELNTTALSPETVTTVIRKKSTSKTDFVAHAFKKISYLVARVEREVPILTRYGRSQELRLRNSCADKAGRGPKALPDKLLH